MDMFSVRATDRVCVGDPTMSGTTTAASSTTAVPTTAAAEPLATPAPDVSESEFLVVALVSSMVLLLVFGAIIIACKRAVLHNSVDEKRKRRLKKRANEDTLAKTVWNVVDTTRDEELAAAATNKTSQLLGDKAPEADGDGVDDQGDDAGDDDDVGYADFSHCHTAEVTTRDIVEPAMDYQAQSAIRHMEERHRDRAPTHAPLDQIRGMEMAFGPSQHDDEDTAILMPPQGATPYVPPGMLPWLAGGAASRRGALDWADGLDVTGRVANDDGQFLGGHHSAHGLHLGRSDYSLISPPRHVADASL